MDYSIKKQKFIDLTRQYIKDIEPLLEVNKKLIIGNIRLFMYKAMIIQYWHKESVKLDDSGNLTYPKKYKTNGKQKQMK